MSPYTIQGNVIAPLRFCRWEPPRRPDALDRAVAQMREREDLEREQAEQERIQAERDEQAWRAFRIALWTFAGGFAVYELVSALLMLRGEG